MSLLLLDEQDASTPFPHPETALVDPNGLLLAGGKLTPDRILQAYRLGIFPWYSEDEPVLWWSPNPRCILWPQEIKISRSLNKSLRKRDFELRINTAFEKVIHHCSHSRREHPGTWILPDMQKVYTELHHLGHAHSYEIWRDQQLIGGLYGLQIGQVFFGESMFSLETDASKAALVYLCQQDGLQLIDCQVTSDHLLSLGAINIPRKEFLRLLNLYAVE